MDLGTLIIHTAKINHIVLKSYEPADKILSEYVRSRKYIGSNDRKFISENLFSSLRNKILIDYLILSIDTDNLEPVLDENIQYIKNILIIISTLIINSDNRIVEIHDASVILSESISWTEKIFKSSSYINEILIKIIGKYSELSSKIELMVYKDFNKIISEIAVRYSMQEWVFGSLLNNPFRKYSIDEIINLSKSLLYAAPLCLRVNAGSNDIPRFLTELDNEGIGCEPSLVSPWGIVLEKRIDLHMVSLFKNGLVEVQDEGSQLISPALNPLPGETILDACAGAGGKSLHIASLQNDQGKVYSYDTDYIKLVELRKRAARNGFKSIRTVNYNNLSKLEFDKVLVDAPCSGMGTARRSPNIKWRLTPEQLKKYTRKQEKLLKEYSTFVKPGGLLVYSTCSILPEENDYIVDNFLKSNTEFNKCSLMNHYSKFKITLAGLGKEDFKLQLLPSVHGSDGFFVAAMIKS